MKETTTRYFIVILATIAMATLFTACGTEATEKTEVTVQVEEQVAEPVAVKEQVAEPVVEEQVEEPETEITVQEEVVVEAEPEVTTEETEAIIYDGIDYETTLEPQEWVKTFRGIINEPKGIVYNPDTNKHLIVENGAEVILEKGDRFCLYLVSPEYVNVIQSPTIIDEESVNAFYEPVFQNTFREREEFKAEIGTWTFQCFITPYVE